MNLSQAYNPAAILAESGDLGKSNIPRRHGPWVTRRQNTGRDQATTSGLVLPDGLVRFPRGPDGTRGFHPGSRPETLEGLVTEGSILWQTGTNHQTTESYPLYNDTYINTENYQSYNPPTNNFYNPQYNNQPYEQQIYSQMDQNPQVYNDQSTEYLYIDQNSYNQSYNTYMDTAYNTPSYHHQSKYATHHYANEPKYNEHYYNSQSYYRPSNHSQEFVFQLADTYNTTYHYQMEPRETKSETKTELPVEKFKLPNTGNYCQQSDHQDISTVQVHKSGTTVTLDA